MFAHIVLLAVSFMPPTQPGTVDQAWSILQEGVDSRSAYTRAKAVHAMALLVANRRAEDIAEKALADTDSNVRVEAATSLGQIGGALARAKLRAALEDKEVKVVIAAANSLYVLKDPAAYEVYYELLTGDRKSSSGLLHSQLATLKDRRSAEKLAFETGIGFVPFGGMGWEAWKTVTHDDTSPVRAAAADKLAHDPDPVSAEALSNACTDKKWRVRAAVVDAIAKRADPALLKSIEPLLFDGNDTVRFDAAAAVVRLSASSDGRRRSK
jgi:HEAT repeat protein